VSAVCCEKSQHADNKRDATTKKDTVVKKEQTQHDEHRPDNLASNSELLNQIVEREAQIQIKSRLMDNMAYQIRTLSNAVIGFSDLLLSEDLTQDQIEYVQEINHAGYGLSTLVGEVLDWSQVLSGKLVIQKTLCELPGIIQQLEQILSAAAKEKGLDYQIVTDPMLPARILSDDERLLRCLLNLIANAIRYTPQGSVRIHVLLEEGASGPMVRFDVIDSGTGITEEKAAHLFEPQGYQIGSDQELLTLLDMGLKITAGLPLTKQLSEFLGGTIEVQSQTGIGSTFSLRIPVGMDLAAQPKLERSQVSGGTDPQNDWQPSKTPAGVVLLVEDQLANRTVISLMLEALGVEVETAADGEEALEKIGHNSYSLILMDLKMPKMDGYEATHRLREKGIEIPIVALSAKVLNGDEHHQIAALFDGFLAKPVDSQKLSGMLQEFVEGFTAPDKKTRSSEQDTVVLEYGN
jgi:CheY-like chemotaxis protein/nitrogen-specific signal transduction histidine kinase